VYIVKFNAYGTIERFKTRLVYGIDYTETFAPIAKVSVVCIWSSLTVNLDWSLQQSDMNNAFLHRELSKELYGATRRMWDPRYT